MLIQLLNNFSVKPSDVSCYNTPIQNDCYIKLFSFVFLTLSLKKKQTSCSILTLRPCHQQPMAILFWFQMASKVPQSTFQIQMAPLGMLFFWINQKLSAWTRLSCVPTGWRCRFGSDLRGLPLIQESQILSVLCQPPSDADLTLDSTRTVGLCKLL